MTALLQDRTERELTAMLAFCARFTAVLAGCLANDAGPDRTEILREVVLALAKQQASGPRTG